MLELENITQRYGTHTVVDGTSFRVEAGQIACLLGPSGCGNTTLLRCIAGFEPLVDGVIRVGGVVFSQPGYYLPPEKRQIGMVFQDYALFPHLDIAANIAFGLNGKNRQEQAARVEELLSTIGLAGEGRKYPHELSGGQQQRVALARALAPRPQLILLDEPFSNLDVELRERLSLEVRHILKQEGCTAILVTHDQQEAFAMADEIGIMWQGKIRQWASPSQLYHHPANRFVAGFIGQGAFLSGESIGKQQLRLETGEQLHCPRFPEAGQRVEVLIRPDEIVPDARSAVQAKVIHRVFRGAQALYTLRLAGGSELLWLAPSHEEYRIGEALGIRLNIRELNAFEG